MKTYIKILTAMSVLALATAAQANTVGGVTVNLTGNNGTSWLGTPEFATYPNPSPLVSPNAFSSENGYGSGVVTGNEPYGNGGLAQSFFVPQTVTLTDLQFGFVGAGFTGMGIALYDLGPTSGYSVTTFSSFYPSYNGGGANLLPAGLQFTYNGGGTLQVADLSFAGSTTPITLQANEEYAVALEPTSSPVGFYWSRSGSTGTPAYGEAYRYTTPTYISPPGVYSALNGGIREFSLAVNQVPEPTIMALMGAGIALSGVLIRRRKA
jgi:hypothetical protein